jgi:3',5'-cyclic AMP phosphodiesterase CpdA
MSNPVRLLHITDSHIFLGGGDYHPYDKKLDLSIDDHSREEAFQLLIKRIAELMRSRGETLDGVIFSGDALLRGKPGGNHALLDLVMQRFDLAANRILAVPGNHDVPRGVAPGSEERYRDFISVWRSAGCITPWLDGVDAGPEAADCSRHVLTAADHSWAVLAINSCNWSHVDAAVPDALREVWDHLPAAAATSKGEDAQEAIKKALNDLLRHDAAHISRAQFERIRDMFERLPKPEYGRQLRMVALHHHLRNPSMRLEFKTTPDLFPLEALRAQLRELDVRVVFHGHKHVSRQYFDYIESRVAPDAPPRRTLVLSGGTFSDNDAGDAASCARFEGLPWTPSVRVSTFAVPQAGLPLETKESSELRLWEYADSTPGGNLALIKGTDLDEVYAKVRACAGGDAKGLPLVVELDLAANEPVGVLPHGYPTIAAEQERDGWLRDLVEWWQRRDSQLQGRIPYIHGNRLLKYSGNIDQMARVTKLLQDRNTSRAIAMLVDPRLDFIEEPKRREFASFCMVQFVRRPDPKGGLPFIDAIGYYRAQEMTQWWPINVAELRHLQLQIIHGGVRARAGRITTMTADARADDAPSPTHAAMPLVDRWLDQAPEKFFVLASSMQAGKLEGKGEAVGREWLDELKTLQQSAHRPAHDGGPVVAIDGLDRLAAYLRAGSGGSGGTCGELANVLDELARHAEKRPDDPKAAESWLRVMESCLTRATELSQKALGAELPR